MEGRIEDMVCSRKDCNSKAVAVYPIRHGYIGYACINHITDQMHTRRFRLKGGVLDPKKLVRNLDVY